MPSASACIVSANASSSTSGAVGQCLEISKSHSLVSQVKVLEHLYCMIHSA